MPPLDVKNDGHDASSLPDLVSSLLIGVESLYVMREREREETLCLTLIVTEY